MNGINQQQARHEAMTALDEAFEFLERKPFGSVTINIQKHQGEFTELEVIPRSRNRLTQGSEPSQ